MWSINKKQSSHDWLDFEPETVLDEYDGPILFTTLDASGKKYLAYFCDKSIDCIRFLVVSFSDVLERKLVGGDIDLREALVRPQMWVFDLDKKWNPISCWYVSLADLPRNLLPKPGVMLRAWMQPVTKDAIVHSVSEGASVTLHFAFAGE